MLPSIDIWSYATTVSEICGWCQESNNRLGYPEFARDLTQEQRQKYARKEISEIPEWISTLNPELKTILQECWSTQPTMRPSFREILREINKAKIMARKSDSELALPVPANPSGQSLEIVNSKHYNILHSNGRSS